MEDFSHEFFENATAEFMNGKIRNGQMIYYKCEKCKMKAVQDVLSDRFLCKQHTSKKKKEKEKGKEMEKEYKVTTPVATIYESGEARKVRRSNRIAAQG